MAERICVGNVPADWIETQLDQMNEVLGQLEGEFEYEVAEENKLPNHLGNKLNRTLASIRKRAENLQRLSENLLNEV
jgi:hypothetical protein